MTRRTKYLIGAAIGLGVAVLAAANVRFVFVAVTSQSGCVAHLKTPGELSGQFRAARSSC